MLCKWLSFTCINLISLFPVLLIKRQVFARIQECSNQRACNSVATRKWGSLSTLNGLKWLKRILNGLSNFKREFVEYITRSHRFVYLNNKNIQRKLNFCSCLDYTVGK